MRQPRRTQAATLRQLQSREAARCAFEAFQEQFKPRVPARAPGRASQTLNSLNSRRAEAKHDGPRASPFKKHPHYSLSKSSREPRDTARFLVSACRAGRKTACPRPRPYLTRQRGLSCGQSASSLLTTAQRANGKSRRAPTFPFSAPAHSLPPADFHSAPWRRK